jgi:hypothetical protein
MFVNNFFNDCMFGILCNAIIYKCRFCQAHCIGLLKSIPTNFILYFSKFYSIFMHFISLHHFLKKLNQKQSSWKRKTLKQWSGCFWPMASRAQPGPAVKLAHVARANGTARANGAVTWPGDGTVARGRPLQMRLLKLSRFRHCYVNLVCHILLLPRYGVTT